MTDPSAPLKAKFTRQGFWRLLSFARPYWPLLVGAAVALLIASSTGLILPAMAGQLIDTVFVKSSQTDLNNLVILAVGIFVLQAVMSFIQIYLINRAGERLVADLRLRLYEHLQKLSLGYFSEQRTGDLMSRFTNDVTIIQSSVTNNLVNLGGNIVLLVGGLTIIVLRDWRLTLLIAVMLPILMFIAMTFGRKVRVLSRIAQAEIGEASNVLSETLGNQKTVKAFTREDHEMTRFSGKIENAFSLTMRRIVLQSFFAATMTFLGFGMVTLVLWYGGQEVLAGHITPGDLIATITYMMVVAAPIGALTGLYSEFQKALGGAERIFAILDEPATVTNEPDAKTLPSVTGQLSFENVSFEYKSGTTVLQNLSFEARPGQVIALIGPSGAGKTTVANLIPRFYDPSGGRILLDGHDIRQIELKNLREQISTVLQEPVLFGTSVLDNILYGRLDATQAEVEQAARAANAAEFIDKLPERYNTLVGEKGVKLSGGQRQRIAIARAILRNPRILILDEATSSLDNESESLVQEALDRLMRDRTTIVIAHRLSTIENADKIIVIDQGRLVEEGTHQELMTHGELYYRLYTRNFEEEPIAV